MILSLRGTQPLNETDLMLPHIYHVLKQAFLQMLLIVSSNWTAILMAVGIFLVSLLLTYITHCAAPVFLVHIEG
jgi:hypothetical protein